MFKEIVTICINMVLYERANVSEAKGAYKNKRNLELKNLRQKVKNRKEYMKKMNILRDDKQTTIHIHNFWAMN